MINRIQNTSFCLHNKCVCFVYYIRIYKYTHVHVYISEKHVTFIYLIYL